jgi:hypothetical protein
MNTKASGIGRVSESSASPGRSLDTPRSTSFVTHLGDVKVETKSPGGDGIVDQPHPLERYLD